MKQIDCVEEDKRDLSILKLEKLESDDMQQLNKIKAPYDATEFLNDDEETGMIEVDKFLVN